jgi:hypothetical protein
MTATRATIAAVLPWPTLLGACGFGGDGAADAQWWIAEAGVQDYRRGCRGGIGAGGAPWTSGCRFSDETRFVATRTLVGECVCVLRDGLVVPLQHAPDAVCACSCPCTGTELERFTSSRLRPPLTSRVSCSN